MKGGSRQGSGRKSKAEEMKLVERLSPLESTAHKKLNEAIEQGKEWAVKLFFDYMYGKPKQMIEQTNVNLDAGKLTAEEAKMINEQLNQSY